MSNKLTTSFKNYLLLIIKDLKTNLKVKILFQIIDKVVY